MERSKSIEILKKLATGTDGRSESARLADIIEDIESALKAGVKRQAVLEALHEHFGFKMTMSGFEKALRKLRNNKKPSTENNRKQKNIDPENTDLVVIPLVSEQMDKDLDSSNEEDENNDEVHPKIDQLKFMEDLKKPPDIARLIEIDRKKRQEERERKRREKEQASRKN